MSASRLRLQKMSAFCSSSRSTIMRNASRLSSSFTTTTASSIVSAVRKLA